MQQRGDEIDPPKISCVGSLRLQHSEGAKEKKGIKEFPYG